MGMVIHEFICENCSTVKDIEVSFGESPPQVITCPNCKKEMHKNFGASGTVIPAHMKAATPYGDSDTFSMAKQSITKKSRRRSFQF